MKKKTKTNYLKDLIEWVDDREQNETLDLTSYKTLERGQGLLRSGLKKLSKSLLRQAQSAFLKSMTSQYYAYIKSGYKKTNRGLKGWRLNDLKQDLRDELRQHIGFSLNLVKTQSQTNLSKLESRFLNWVNSRTQGMDKQTLKEALKLEAVDKKEKKHIKFILKDQTMKLNSSFDEIVAKKYEAIAFIWHTRQDKRVAGNPAGKYPDIDDNNKMHGDHYSRQGRLYFYPNSWALKQGLINKSKIKLTTDLVDGMPGKPIGCRCYAENLYDLEDIPKEYLSDSQ